MSPDGLALPFAHAIPIQHGRDADPAITLGLLAVGVFVAVGGGMLLADRALARPASRAAATALAWGALAFLLFDLLKETASLGQGVIARPGYQAMLVAAFAAGLVGTAAAARGIAGARVAWAFALVGVGAHGMGEAWIVGTEAYSSAITAPLQATSFLLHKLIEGFAIVALASAALGRANALRAGALVALLALLGGMAGFAMGPGTAPVVLFAVGAGGTAFALMLLARRVTPDIAGAAWAALGVAVVYAAGLLHQF